jgi:hypothetical protein
MESMTITVRGAASKGRSTSSNNNSNDRNGGLATNNYINSCKTSNQILSILVAALLFLSIPSMLAIAKADDQQLPQPSERQIIDASVSGPAFLNAYWTDRSTSSSSVDARKQVGPGDGASTLAIVMVNRGFSAITGVTASLALPQGFAANGRASSDNTAIATVDSVVDAGQTFTLYFDLDVSDNTHVGTYYTDLNVAYQRLYETGSPRNNETPIAFRLTGKVILDPVAVTHNLVPGVSNNVNIAIRNTGSSPATGVIVSITGISINGGSSNTIESSSGSTIRPQITNFGTNTFTIGTIPPKSNSTLTTVLFPNISAGGNTAGIQLQITYNDATGSAKTLTPAIGVIVLQNAPSVIGVRAASGQNQTDNRIVAGKADSFVLEIANKGTSRITNAVVTMQSSSNMLNILGDSKWAVEAIDPGSQAELETQVFASTSLIGNPATFDVTIDYILDGSPKTEKYVLGTYVDGEIALRVYDLAINYVGATPTLVGNILNEGNTAAFFTTVELMQTPRENRLTVRSNNLTDDYGGSGGQFRQQSMQEQRQQDIIINNNNNNSNNNLSAGRLEQSNPFGTFLSLQTNNGNNNTNSNITNNGVGGQFRRLGNNNINGTTFSPPSPQYLGDLTANSPLPFSISLSIPRINPGTSYPVTLKITYKDNLRNAHEFVTSANALVASPQLSTNVSLGGRSQNPFWGLFLWIVIVVIGTAAAAVVATLVIIRKIRAKAKRLATGSNNGPGTSENIEDILENPASDAAKDDRIQD